MLGVQWMLYYIVLPHANDDSITHHRDASTNNNTSPNNNTFTNDDACPNNNPMPNSAANGSSSAVLHCGRYLQAHVFRPGSKFRNDG